MDDRESARIAPEYARLERTQDYSPKPRIDGVVLHDLRRFVEDGGELLEVGRLAADAGHPAFAGFRVRQVNYSLVEPGAIKAWHLHHEQDDVWFVPPEHKLVVGLLDCRDGSPTKDARMRLVLGAGRAQLLLIPRGVAHGMANLGRRPASVLYLLNAQFDAARPDERRLPWDLLGADFWSVAPG